MTMTVGEKEEKNILNNEIHSWKGFEYALEKKIDYYLTRC
jgi:hypothetical protein